MTYLINRFNNSNSGVVFGGVFIVLMILIYLMVYDLALALSVLGMVMYLGIFLLIGWKFYQTGFDLFSPLVFLGSFIFLIYPIKALYVLFSLSYGPFVNQNYKFLLDARHMIYFGEALTLSAFCCVIFLLMINVRWIETSSKPLFSNRVWNLQKISFSMIGVSLAMVVLFSWLIFESGGLGFYLQSVAGRQSFFYGRYFIFLLIDLFPKTSCFFLASYFERINHYPKIYVFAILMIIILANIGVSVLAGNRSTFLLGFFIPFMVYWHYRVKPVKITQVALVIGLILFVSIFYLSTFRGRNIVERLTPESIWQNISVSINNFFPLIFGGPDIVQLDTLMVTMQEIPSTYPYFAGDSLKALLAFPIPRAFYPDKPVRGNWLFTEAVFPSWRINLSGFTVSYMGDWYMNFGVAGAVLGMVLLGLMLRKIFLKLNPKVSWVSAVFYGLILSSTLTVFRSDIFSLINFGITVLFVIATILLCSSKKQMTLIA